MALKGDAERSSLLYRIASQLADRQQVDWPSVDSDAPENLRETIRGLRLLAQISPTVCDESAAVPPPADRHALTYQPYDRDGWGPLLIEARVGAGAFGEVFRAKDPNLERKVALKLYYAERAASTKTAADLLREGKMLARVQHPNVATVYGAERHADRVGIWMEYIEGATLAETLENTGVFGVAEAMRIGGDVCRALAALHDAGILHRDVKASNIMLTGDGRVVLMDLGVSRNIDDHETEKLYGTPLFVAPETLLHGTCTPQSDLYSVGVLLFLMVSGEYPAAGASLTEIRNRHENGQFQSIREVRLDLPESFVTIVERALAGDPADRFATASEFIDALERAMRPGAEPSVKPSGPSRPAVRPKALLWSLGILVPLAVIGLATVLLVPHKLPWFTGEEESPPRILVSLFENRTGDESLDPVGLMAADAIEQGLSRLLLSAHVVPFTTVLETQRMVSAFTTQPIPQSPAARAEAMAATMVIDGAYYLEADTLIFLVDITDTQRDKVLHGPQPVKGSRNRPTVAIEYLKQQITTLIGIYLYPGWSWLEDGEPTDFGEIPEYGAYVEFAEGLAHFGENYVMALRHFERATAIDSSFILPQFWTCGAYANLGQPARAAEILRQLDKRRDQLTPFYRYKLDYWKASQRGDHLEAIRYLTLAAEIAPKDGTINYLLALAHLSANYPRLAVETLEQVTPVDAIYSTWYGYVRQWLLDRAYYSLGDYRRALANADLAIEKRPNHIWSYSRKVRALAALDRPQQIDAVIARGLNMAFDTGSPALIMNAAARELRVQGRSALARDYADRAIQWCRQQPDPNRYRTDLAEALRLAERWSEAQTIFAQLSQEKPERIDYLGKLGTIAARLGNTSEARNIQNGLEHWAEPYARGANLFWCAGISAVLGEREQAMAYLREAVRQGLDGRDHVIEEMAFEALRDYPPFRDLIKPLD